MMPNPERILLIRLSSLGDVVLTTPAIRAVRQAYPTAYIAMLVGKRSVDVLHANPHLNAVIPFDRQRPGCNSTEMVRVASLLRHQRFDLSIDFQRKWRTSLLALASGARCRVGFHEGGGFLCTIKVPDPLCGRKPYDTNVVSHHATVRNFQLLKPFGISWDDLTPEIFLSKEDARFAEETLPRSPGRRRLGLFPGAGWKLREWMPDRFAAIGDRAVSLYDAEVVLFGGPSERPLVQRVAELMHHPATVLAGTLSVGQLAALIGQCDLFVSNDTGPMHISVAMQTPTIALFGPGDHLKFGPLGPEHVLIRHAIPCSPCKQFTDRCKDNVCMKRIRVDEVWEAIRQRWDSR